MFFGVGFAAEGDAPCGGDLRGGVGAGSFFQPGGEVAGALDAEGVVQQGGGLGSDGGNAAAEGA